MKFACFAYYSEEKWAKLPETEQNEILEAYHQYYQELKAKGILLGGYGLKGVSEGTKMSLTGHVPTESPLPKNYEQLGGYIVIDTKDIEDAKKIISRHPGLKMGSIEIWEIDEQITELVGANNK